VQRIFLEFHTAEKEQYHNNNHRPIQDITKPFSAFYHRVVPLFAFVGAHGFFPDDRLTADLTMGVLRYFFGHGVHAQQYDTT
jgi:hypothetical protein